MALTFFFLNHRNAFPIKSQFERNVKGDFAMFLLPLEVTRFSNKLDMLDIREGSCQQ